MASHPEKRITWSKWELFSHRFVPYVPCAQEGSKLNSYVVVLEVQIRARSVAGQHYLSKISMWCNSWSQLIILHIAFNIQYGYCSRAGSGPLFCFWEYQYQEISSFKDFCFLLFPNPCWGGELIPPIPPALTRKLLFICGVPVNNKATQLHSQDIYYPHEPLIKMQSRSMP